MSAVLELDLRAATLDDVGMVADLEAARDPEDPADPQVLRHWWITRSVDDEHMRLVAEQDGAAIAYVNAGHKGWTSTPTRFGTIRAILHRDLWSESNYSMLITRAEEWLRSEGAATATTNIRADFDHELDVHRRAGYQEVRRHRVSELDLVAGRDGLLAGAARCRRHIRDEGVTVLKFSEDKDPKRLTKLYELTIESEKDVPTTVPWRAPSFDEWKRDWFQNPGIREDRLWIAREGDAIVGLSLLRFPPTRGLPWIELTGTSRAVRGRGIARALKYETVAQAIDLGYEKVRTTNDGANAPILHLNEEMGFRLVRPLIELHRKITS